MQQQTARPTIPFPTIDLSSDNPIAEILNAPRFSETTAAIYKTAASQRALISAVSSALIYTLVRNAKPQHVVEIGTYYGGTSEVICQALYENGSGTLHTVAPFEAESVVPDLRLLAAGAAPAPGILSHDLDGVLLPAVCPRHQAGDCIGRRRPFLSGGAVSTSSRWQSRLRDAGSCWSTTYRNRAPITRRWISCNAIRIGRNAGPAVRNGPIRTRPSTVNARACRKPTSRFYGRRAAIGRTEAGDLWRDAVRDRAQRIAHPRRIRRRHVVRPMRAARLPPRRRRSHDGGARYRQAGQGQSSVCETTQDQRIVRTLHGRAMAGLERRRTADIIANSDDHLLTDPNRRYCRCSISTPPNTTVWPAPWKYIRPLLPSRRFAVTKIAAVLGHEIERRLDPSILRGGHARGSPNRRTIWSSWLAADRTTPRRNARDGPFADRCCLVLRPWPRHSAPI